MKSPQPATGNTEASTEVSELLATIHLLLSGQTVPALHGTLVTLGLAI